MQNGCQLRIEKLTPRALVMIGCLATLAPAFAQDDLRIKPARLSLTVKNEPPDELCRRFDPSDASQLATVSLNRTFHDDFDAHPLSTGKWVPHYAGGAAGPDARYWGGAGSDLKRQAAHTCERQIHLDPRYSARQPTPLGLAPFRIRDGILSIVASRTPPDLK